MNVCMVQRRSAPRGMVMASDQPPDCPFTRYLHHFGAPTPVYFMLHHMYFTYCIIIFILYTLRYFVLYTIYYVRYTIYYILYTIYYILYIYMYLVPPTPPQATHRRGGILTHPQGEGTHTTGGPATRNTLPYIYNYVCNHIYIYIHTYVYVHIVCAWDLSILSWQLRG